MLSPEGLSIRAYNSLHQEVLASPRPGCQSEIGSVCGQKSLKKEKGSKDATDQSNGTRRNVPAKRRRDACVTLAESSTSESVRTKLAPRFLESLLETPAE